MISLNQLKKTRSSVAAFSILIAIQSLYAQSADAQVTFTSTISALTCTISINNASGSSSATLAIGNTSLASGGNGVAQFTKLTTPTAFTFGFKGSGGSGLAAVTDTCAYTGKLNVAFGKGASNTETPIGTTRALQRPTTDTIGVGIEIESVNGSTITPIKDFTSIPTYTGGSLVSSQHGLASVNAGTLLNFQATAVKHFALATPITAGTYRDNYQTTTADSNPLLQSYIRYGLNDFFTPALDSLMSSNFQSLGTQFNFGNFLGSQSFNVKTSRLTGSRQAQGQQYSININSAPMGSLTFGSNLSYQSKYFLEANTGLSNYSFGSDFSTTNTLKSTRNLYTNLNLDQWGGLSLNLTQQDAWSRNNINQNLNINYSIRIKRANLTTSLGRAKNNFGDNANRTLDSVSLNVSIPLDLFSNRGNLSAYISQTGSSPVSENIYYNGNYADDINYSLSQSKQSSNVSQSVSLNLSHALGYSSLGYANSQAGSSSTSFGTSGGVVFHRGGLIASPPVGETFGIMEVPGGNGVRAAGSKSTINRSGYGVVPNLSAYAMNIVDLDLSQAPLDVELESTSQRIAPVSVRLSS